jgi:hypothetical protein
MARNQDPRALLLSDIRNSAGRVIEAETPAAWSGHQLVALIRHWGYRGMDLPMPDAFAEFDHIMTDLECFPDGRMTNDEHIVAGAREVLAALDEM